MGGSKEDYINDVLSDRPYNDDLPPEQRLATIPNINQQTNMPHGTDEQLADQLRNNANRRLLEQDEDMHMATGQPSELNDLIPKMASGTATKAEKMRFYDLTGTGV